MVFNRVIKIICILGMVAISSLLCFPIYAAEFFSDGFETGDLKTAGTDGTCWAGTVRTSVTSEKAHSGSNSLQFLFPGDPDLTKDSWAEQRFIFGEDQTDFYVRYYLHLPANYKIRDSGGANNNKFISFWEEATGYSGPMARNMETSATGVLHKLGYKAKIAGWPHELDCSGSVGFIPNGGRAYITDEMIGNWTCFEHHIKTETAGETGAFQMWVNGSLVIDDQNLTWKNGPCSPGCINRGYLMGWANSGFDEDTIIYIDDVVFSDKYIGPLDTNKNIPLPPENLNIIE